MPTGPKGVKRPRDTSQLAKFIVDAATGEIAEPSAREVRARKAGSVSV